ncbi:MAG: Na+:solute symporter [Deltaproteobacteria bacterium]|nr:Na+:solute symporter [Deltaproteobacteria bacterium]
MHLSNLDIGIVIGYLAVSLVVGMIFSKRATRSIDDYFVGGRSMPWWLAGTSMIATALSIDTPLGITGLVAKHGVQGVWFAWSYIIGGAGAFGAFLFASLLRRSRIITSAELMELRYSGKEAAFLRAFKGIYFGILTTCISMAWGIKSVLVVSQEALGWNALPALAVIIAITLVYTAASGIWGVATTDFFQFIIATIGALVLAYYAVDSVGGLSAIPTGLAARYGGEAAERLHFLPRPGTEFFQTFLVFMTLKWWGNPSGVETQRIAACKDEKHATFATMLFTVVHFAMNYWPMILAALVSLIAFPTLPADKAEQGYAMLMVKLLPKGMLGVMIASQAAAFMSTIESQMNMGASYMVNDLYRRFIRPEASKRHFVLAGQACTVLMLGLAVLVAFFMKSVQSAWYYLAMLTAGYGFVVVARWFWWRVNAWAEIAGLVGSGVGTFLASHVLPFQSYGTKYLFAAGLSIASWVTVALLTPPTTLERLGEFCRVVRPYPTFWGPVRKAFPEIVWSTSLGRNVGLWIVGSACAFCVCFGLGHLLLGSVGTAWTLLGAAGIGLLVVLRYWRP